MIIVLASHNENKVKEISGILKPLNIQVKSLNDFGLKAPEETGLSFEENSLIKAKYALEKTGLPSLGDDSGFCIKSLNGFPGISSARFAEAVEGYPQAFKILNECISQNDRRAYFVTMLSFVYKHDEEVKEKTFEGKVCGEFVYPARGENGFGYCPVFKPEGYSETFSELCDSVRVKINHRAQAVKKFVDYLKTLSQDNK